MYSQNSKSFIRNLNNDFLSFAHTLLPIYFSLICAYWINMNMYDTLKASNCVIPIVKKLNSKIDLRQNQGNNVDLKIGQAEKAHYVSLRI